MNEKQLALIMQIIREQMGDYLAEALVNDLANSIEEGINDNMPTIESLAEDE